MAADGRWQRGRLCLDGEQGSVGLDEGSDLGGGLEQALHLATVEGDGEAAEAERDLGALALASLACISAIIALSASFSWARLGRTVMWVFPWRLCNDAVLATIEASHIPVAVSNHEMFQHRHKS